jgi:ABC-2 type transport system ATP-binding protein
MKAVSLRNLSKTYKNGVHALKGIDLDVEEGDFFALLGPNGAGKTTAIGILTSLVNKTSGSVEVFGHNLDTELAAAKACIGLVPQEVNFNMFETVSTILLNQAGFYGIPRNVAHERLEKYLNKLQLWEKRNSVARGLSGGMKRRLMIVRALLHEPRLLILDEPTAGVDIEVRRSMWDFIREVNAAGTTIILTTHYLEEAENLCRNVAIINQGKIIENEKMSTLLLKLNTETFILNLREAVSSPPTLVGYNTKLTDGHTLEVELNKEQNLNEVFLALSAQGIGVVSMRNKSNRLEELFLSMVERGSDASKKAS